MQYAVTDRTTLKRLPKRGDYNHETVHAILDEGFVCHVGFAVEGRPFVIPTGYARVDETIYIHGSAASRMLRTLSSGVDVCLTVTLLDGLVLARSAFHHSMNYRSVVVFGKAYPVDDLIEKSSALRALTEHIVPGRWEDVREPDEQEMKATLVLKLALKEVSAKVRTGPPIDDEPDYAMPIWAGILPLQMVPGTPIKDDRAPENAEPPAYIKNYKRGRERRRPECI
jgi:nitroimidazol reductase NimA-like FMN-containing flavoprotein (pyridoxamine 5'-phosphate oxidase superfamily)